MVNIKDFLRDYRPGWTEKVLTETARILISHDEAAGHPLRGYMLNLIRTGWARTKAYNQVKGAILGRRKQAWFAYWEYLKRGLEEKPTVEKALDVVEEFLEEEIEIEEVPEAIMYAHVDDMNLIGRTYLHASYRDMLESEPEHYNNRPLSAIHKWLSAEVKEQFPKWRVYEDYEPYVSRDFDRLVTGRVFEFEITHTDTERLDEVAYYMVYENGMLTDERMWRGFNMHGFLFRMKQIGAWE